MARETGLRRLWWAAAVLAAGLPLLAGAPAGSKTALEKDCTAPVRPVVGRPEKFSVSPPLRDLHLTPRAVDPDAACRETRPPMPLGKGQSTSGAQAAEVDTVVQLWPGLFSMPATSVQWEGLGNLNGVAPPDPVGDVGPNHYVQWVNLSLAIWDKSGTLLFGPVNGNTLWQSLGGICSTYNDGDPIVLYDNLADRWLISQFVVPGPYYQAIAVSATSDPMGSWYLYCFKVSDTKMNDYPKFGVWPDGYYMTVNQFTSSWAGAGVFVFDRDKMLAGDPTASFQYFDVGSVDLNFGGMLPSHVTSRWNAPAAGTPNYVLEVDDGTWIPGYSNDAIRIWECHVDWTTPANSTFGLAGYVPSQVLDVAPFNPLTCTRDCIPQPGTTQRIDAIGDRLMYRLDYRNRGSYQTLVVNHTVDAGSGRTGVRWYELRKPTGTPWAVHQQGTFAPADTENRWMGSAATDHAGNIAVGYTAASGSVYPSVRYAGRLESDPPGELTQGEAVMIAGTGSQLNVNRWGDYTAMSVDPVDDCTFWYTGEYVASTGSFHWNTRIGAFKFPNCTMGPVGTLTGQVTASGSGAPIQGAVVQATSGGTTVQGSTGIDGTYALSLPEGTYAVNASAWGYQAQSLPGVAIAGGATTTQNFSLSAAATWTVSGIVRDAGTHWPLYASIDVAGYPGGTRWTDPVTGAYSLSLPAGGPYAFQVKAWTAGYQTLDASVGPVSGNLGRNFDLSADADACTAPGYGSVLLSESFEGSFPPAGWSVVDGAGTGNVWRRNDYWTRSNSTGGSGYCADADSDGACNGFGWDTTLRSPSVNLPAGGGATLSFRSDFQDFAGAGEVWTEISTNGGSSWTTLFYQSTDETPGTLHSIDLSAYSGSTATFRWRYSDNNDGCAWYWLVDDVLVRTCGAPSVGGLVVGQVTDANTGEPLTGATVSNAVTGRSATASSTLDPAVGDAFYCLYSTGSDAITAQKGTAFDQVSHSPSVSPGTTVGQDFVLPAGQLGASPSPITATLVTGSTTSKTLTLTNGGGRGVIFQVREFDHQVNRAGPFEQPMGVVKPFKQGRPTAEGLEIPQPAPAPPYAAGDVLDSWPAGIAAAWGVAYDGLAGNVWVSSPGASWGGTATIYEYSAAGTATGRTWPYTWGPTNGPADCAYNWLTGKIWVMNIASGVSNCIYEIDPSNGPTGNTICPGGGTGFSTSQRGLAYDPSTDTWYAGGWNDSMIYHFQSDGTPINSVNVGLAISGLAYNPATGHLFVMVNASPNPVYVLDAADNYNVLGQFTIPGFSDYSGAGLEIDCDGNLWAVDQITSTVYKVSSGESATLCTQDVPWLSVTPDSGTVPASGQQALSVGLDASSLSPMQYQAWLKVFGDTPYPDVVVPVTLTVTYPAMTATAGASPTSGNPPLTVSFTGAASGGDGGPYTWEWDFDDGSAHATVQNPSHTYTAAGTFHPVLTARDSHGDVGVDSHLTVTTASPPPTVSGVAPSKGSTAGGTSVTLTGTNFRSGASVTFGGVAATGVTVVSATSITCTTPAHAAGAVDVRVANSDGQGATLAGGFTYANPPVISSVSKIPSPFRLKILGSNFHNPCTVKINGTAVTTQFKNDTKVKASGTDLKALCPKGVTVQVTVTNDDDGVTSSPVAFTK